MPASPDADDITKPLDADATNYPASYGAAEFRSLKTKINKMFLLSRVDVAGAEYLAEINGRGIYANYTVNPALGSTILYGFAANVTRLGKDNHVVGGQFTAILDNNVTLTAGELFGVVTQVITQPTNSLATMVGAEFCVANQTPANTKTKLGVDVVWKDRGDGAVTPVSGLGTNQYNTNSFALNLSSQPRGTAGEYCGWTTGLMFNEYCIDLSLVGGVPTRGQGIDAYFLHYDGGADPRVAYRVDSVLRMRSMQSISWFDGTDSTRLYVDPFDGRFKVVKSNGAGYQEVWGVNVTTGNVYKNGVFQY